MAKQKLSLYRAKRDFAQTDEPRGETGRQTSAARLRFVVQKHAATSLHYDLRLELDGVIKRGRSPRVPPSIRARNGSHGGGGPPIEYGEFEGTIPKGEYGGGTVMLWDADFGTAESRGPRSGSS